MPAYSPDNRGSKAPELLAPAGHIDALKAALAAGADAVYFGGRSFSNRMRAKNFDSLSIRDAISLVHSCGAKAYITVNTRLFDDEMNGGELDELLDSILGGKSADVSTSADANADAGADATAAALADASAAAYADANADALADALIVADFGVARYIRQRYPHAVLHASTQTSLSSYADCEMLRGMGFTRLVLPRELNRGEIRRLCDSLRGDPNGGFETEMFIHGAHCVSLSGQCLLSYVMGGRSGNRGECAQPCRLPYTLHSQSDGSPDAPRTVLSLADMCLAGRITDVITSGVTSLKLEGRLKSADYVFGVTRIYRRLLDERRNATNDEIRELERLFSRGFTDGYFCGRYAGMSASCGGDPDEKRSSRSGLPRGKNAPKEISLRKITPKDITPKEITRLLSARIDAHHTAERARISSERIPVAAEFTLAASERARLSLFVKSAPSISAEVFSADEVPECGGKSAGRDYVVKSLTKMGSTPFSLAEDDTEVRLDGVSWLPTSAMNDMRRRCAALLEEKLKAAPELGAPGAVAHGLGAPNKAENGAPTASCAFPSRKTGEKPLRAAIFPNSAVFLSLSKSAQALVGSFFDFIYLPVRDLGYVRARLSPDFPAERAAALMPPLTPDDGDTVRLMSESGVSRVLCSTLGQIRLARSLGLTADVSLRANITSSYSLAYYAGIADGFVMQSPEALTPLSCPAPCGGVFRAASTVYGAIPVMVLSRCVFASCGNTKKCPHSRALGRIGSERLAVYGDIPPEDRCRGFLTDRKNVSFPVFAGADCVNYIYSAKKIKAKETSDPAGANVYIFACESEEEIKKVLRNAE